jgi:translocation and assembly module TamB
VARPTSAAGQQAAQQQARSDAARAKADAQARASEAGPLLANVNVQVDLGEDFRLQGMGIDTRLAGVLTLTAKGPLTEMPSLVGRVRTEGGTFRAYGQQLIIQRGFINFSGQISNPTLDIVALRPNYTSDQRVGVQVMGTALLPRVRLYSEPALPDNQTLAWLLLGRPAPNSGAEAAMLQSAALALLGGREGRGLAANFGLDELSFSGGGDGELSSASVTLGKRLSDRLYAAYEHSLAGTGGTLMIFLELSRRWTLRGQAGENSAVDLIYRLTFD